ncbi:MAG: hypothetical protein KAG53_05805 [Endozoicomonadaceae bacterium]|nr:hypothetical protein [Endozoicomonadaceae bacterium]
MSKLSQQKQKQKKLAWAEHLKSQRESGLSLQTYCEQHSGPANSGIESASYKAVPVMIIRLAALKSNQSGFVTAKVVEASVAQGLAVILPDGMSISGINEHNHGLIKHLLGTLT